MKITTSTDGNVTVLDLDGNLTIGAADEAFSGVIDQLLERGRTIVVLDMGHVPLVDFETGNTNGWSSVAP